MANAPVVAILVTKRNPIASLGRPQKYRWRAVNWNNRKTLASSAEAYTNKSDAVAAAVQLFADATVDLKVLDAANLQHPVSRSGQPLDGSWLPSVVYLIDEGVSGMQALRVAS